MKRFKAVVWALLQAAATVGALQTFGRVIRWVSARPISEAPVEALRVLPKGCPAFYPDHGTFFCEHLGMTYNRPAAFILLVLFGLASGIFAMYLGATKRGLSAAKEAFGFGSSKVNA